METGSIIVYVPPTLFSIVALAFLLLWWLNIVSAWQWAAGFAQTAAGFVLSTFSIEPSFDAFSSGLIFIGAAYCYGSGLLTHFGIRRFRRERGVIVLAYVIVLAHAVFIEQNLVYQLFITDIFFALLLGLAISMVARQASRPVDIALVAASTVVVLDSVCRTVFFTFFTDSSSDLSDFADSAYNLAVHISTITVCMIFPFTALGAIASSAIERHRTDAECDPMTGLLNRRGFDRRVQRLTPFIVPSSVLVCDIDHFKRINDGYGHAVGDKVINALARDLQQAIGNAAYVARFGGEEFAALVPGVSSQDAATIANMLRVSFSSRKWSDLGIPHAITVSVGVSNVAHEERAIEHALLRADDALYAAKSAGRNEVSIRLASAGQPGGRLNDARSEYGARLTA